MKTLNALKDKCLKTLSANHIDSSAGKLFVAGGNQFRTLWTRDFCYAVPGLLASGYADTVERQLRLIYGFKNNENLLPRGIDVINPKTRVLKNTAFKFLATEELKNYNKPLVPEYLGEHRTPAFDSNLLVMISIAELGKFKKQKAIFFGEAIQPLLNFYDSYFENGLLNQPEYSDWQDSARRTGSLLLTHLLYLRVLSLKEELGLQIEESKIEALQTKIQLSFFRDQLLQEQPNLDQQSLDSYCYLIHHPELLPTIDINKLYSNLKKSPLWQQSTIPGIPVWPEHSSQNVSWTTKIVGLRHYHDGLHWGWLVAEAAKIALLQKDIPEFERIAEYFSSAIADNEFVSEIYICTNSKLQPFQSFLYKSESPFTWSAAKWLEALSYS